MSAFRVSPHRPAAAELARVMNVQLMRARDALARWRDDPEDAVHETRRRLKKVRAAARLARAIDAGLAREINEACRMAGRSLGAGRDADVAAETARALADDLDDREAAGWLRRFAAQPNPAEALGRDLAVQRARDALRLTESPVRALAEARSRHGALRRAMGRVLRRAEKARQAAHAPGADDEARHAWRRRVKDVGYAARLLRDAWPLNGHPPTAAAAKLGRLLGEEHDLIVLTDALRAADGAPPEAFAAIEARLARIRAHAEAAADLPKS